MTHNVRTPLNTIISMLKLIQGNLGYQNPILRFAHPAAISSQMLLYTIRCLEIYQKFPEELPVSILHTISL